VLRVVGPTGAPSRCLDDVLVVLGIFMSLLSVRKAARREFHSVFKENAVVLVGAKGELLMTGCPSEWHLRPRDDG